MKLKWDIQMYKKMFATKNRIYSFNFSCTAQKIMDTLSAMTRNSLKSFTNSLRSHNIKPYVTGYLNATSFGSLISCGIVKKNLIVLTVKNQIKLRKKGLLPVVYNYVLRAFFYIWFSLWKISREEKGHRT